MEEKLYNECIAMRHQGKPVKRWWFVTQGKQILDELEPDHNFLFPNYWFERFQNRYNISLRRKTHCSPKPTTALKQAIKKFQSSLLRLRSTGNLKASVPQIWIRHLYHLCWTMEKTYDKKGVKDVQAQKEQSGLDNRLSN